MAVPDSFSLPVLLYCGTGDPIEIYRVWDYAAMVWYKEAFPIKYSMYFNKSLRYSLTEQNVVRYKRNNSTCLRKLVLAG